MTTQNFVPVRNIFNAVLGEMDLNIFERFIIAGESSSERTYVAYLLLEKLFTDYDKDFGSGVRASSVIIDPGLYSSNLIHLLRDHTSIMEYGHIAHFPLDINEYRTVTKDKPSKVFTFALAELGSVSTLTKDMEYLFGSVAQLKTIAMLPGLCSKLRRDKKQALDATVKKLNFSTDQNTLLINPCVDDQNNFTIETYLIFEE